MSRVALLDADIIAYTAAHATCTWVTEDEAWADMGAAEVFIKEIAEEWTKGADCTEYRMVLSPDDRTNYRLLVWPEYKQHRKASKKPPHLKDIVKHIRDEYPVKDVPYLEGDDVMGILHTRNPESSVIVSSDKDMATIPGWVYNPNKDYGNGPRHISKTQAQHWLLTQVLTGDSTDGYKGAKGVGPKRAEALLDNHFRLTKTAHGFALEGDAAACWSEVVETFESKGQTVEEAVQNLAMARILTEDLYSKEGDTRTVWLPTETWGVNTPFELP
jgi:hypothetical protein